MKYIAGFIWVLPKGEITEIYGYTMEDLIRKIYLMGKYEECDFIMKRQLKEIYFKKMSDIDFSNYVKQRRESK